MNKTYRFLKKIIRGFRWLASLLGVMLVLHGCSKSPGLNFDNAPSAQSGKLLSPNVNFQISYEQKSMVFTPFWPQDIVAGIKAKYAAEDTELMIDYDHTFEYIAFDEDRNLILQTDYLEGNRAQNMPDKLYKQVAQDMPDRSGEKKIISIRTGNGLILYSYADGSESSVSLSDDTGMKIPEEVYKYWLSLAESQTDTATDARIARNLQELQQSGVDFKQLDNSTIYMEIQPEPDEQDEIGLIRQKIDLKTGEPLMSITQFKDGRYESVSFMNYKQVGNVPVLQNSETLIYGSFEGEWQAIQRHVVNRTNIQVISNF